MQVILLLSLLAVVVADLKFIIAIWRHGDRAPETKPYPADIYNETDWPRGYNQLTNIGIQQTYQLGQWFRERYVNNVQFLPSNFDYKKIFYRSTDSERAIQSCMGHQAGLYPAKDEMQWSNAQSLRGWQPIPLHTAGDGNPDPLLKPTSYNCPAYTNLCSKVNGLLYENLNSQYRELFTILSNYTKMEVTSENVKQLYDITREMAHDLAQPAWINQIWNGTSILNHIIELKRLTRTSEFNTREKSRYRAGYLVNDWCKQIEAASKGTSKRLATLYSSHDGTVSALTYAMGINDDKLVPYAAALIAEYHSNNTVKLIYKTDTENILKVKGCTEYCPLEKFLEEMEPVRIRSIQELDQTCSAAFITSLISTVLFVFYLF